MGVKKASNRRRIAGIRRILAEMTTEETPPPPPPPPSTPTVEQRPDWLPEDWKMEVKWRKDHEKADRYYICPKSGRVFRSKPEVFHYLNPDSYPSRYLTSGKVENSLVPYFGGYTLGPSGGSKHLFAALEDYPLEWLPTGWLLEFGTWRNGVSEVNNYKCYFDPLTGSRFYTKEAVLQYLEAHKPYPTSIQGGRNNANMKESCNMNCPQNVLTQIDYSPSGLPHGWVKEIRISKPKSSQKVRRDSFYIDTVSGYAFRSNKDAVRYLENKEISRLAFKLEESHLPKARFSTEESLAIAVRQPELKNDSRVCHFSKKKKKSNKMIMAEISDPPHSPSLPSVYHASAESDDISKTTCSALETFEQLREDVRLETGSLAMPAFEREGFPDHPTNKMEPEDANDRASDMQSVENKILDLDVTLRQFKMARKKLQPKNRGRKCRPVLSNTQKNVTTVDAIQSGPSKRKAVKATTLPLRDSKRIAGVEADPAVSGFGNGEQPQSPKSSQPDESQPTIAKDSDSSCEPQAEQATMEQQANPSAEQATKDQQANPSMKLPFGDSWPDPSIEFAVKTLTGDIPVLQDTMALQEFFLRQLRSVQKLLLPSDGTPTKDDGEPSSPDNGKESKQCRQKFD